MGKENKKLITVTLVIALFGGLPGSCSIFSYFREKSESRPRLSGQILNFIIGGYLENKDSADPDSPGCFILLTATLTNSGNTPIIPSVFDMKSLIDNKWYSFKRILIPDDIDFSSETQDILLENSAQNDLQRYKDPITKTSPAYGFLMFTNEELSVTQLRDREKIPIELICIDISDKEHKVKFELDLSKHQTPTVYPKHGLSWDFINGTSE